ncbi:MBL fold metallo-hydrolase [Mangrovibacterium marinum]|uniref:7, 8-dihydropterin-6-yl-methyl-4-(Beta-D-ribofuranosyl)aminobenzene 5'-phosphate synthase n=1 Tax=Mangrovibacterium marinum TaxID=1639118 RepID=A0A2T5C3B0_9BACT|nr:MBL fold metallo-hydrolase [Mangrovibacterium marinum]PTN09209.1 7,8-dihydropterin-6-yl-methyl-4-(beta-D-ribofuranosyl)aminobenzene 5'-phosphate synthase [Mangrovibacterium marinum]
MKITILTENIAGGYCCAEHGLSYLIEHDEKNILLDAGHSDVFLKNANHLGINLIDQVDQIVLSHGHWDHGDGLRYIQNKPLLTHPKSFMKRFRKRDQTNLGLSLSPLEIEEQFDLQLSSAPVQISEHIFFLGEIPRTNSFEAQTTAFVDENGNDDFVPDDSALAFVENEALIIVTGCSHSGICNICEYAKKITGLSHIKAVIGGFHLKQNNLQTKETINYFMREKVETLLPSHCTDLPALAAFQNPFSNRFVKTGQTYQF